MKVITVLLMVFFVLSCSTDNIDELKRLCQMDAGLIIHKRVEASGYFDRYTDCHHCWKSLISSTYDYVEFCNDTPRNPLTWTLSEVGCYRVSKVDRDSGRCHSNIESEISKKHGSKYRNFRKTSCIAVDSIEGPLAQYEYNQVLERWAGEDGVSKFTRSEISIKEREGGGVLGSLVSYGYNSMPKKPTPTTCSDLSENYKNFYESNLPESVIINSKELSND